MMSTGLAVAVAAPAAGVLLYSWLHEHPRLTRSVDNFIYIAFPGLVAWYVLPAAWRERDPLPVLAVAAGSLVVWAAERIFRARSPRTDDVAVLVGASGAAVHVLLEGAALATRSEAGLGDPLIMAVALHRLLVGSVIWWLLRPRHGPLAVWLAVGFLCAATMAGYALGSEALGPIADGPGATLYQAFVAGALLHVVFHQGRRDHAHDLGGPDREAGTGTVAGWWR